MRRIMLAAFLVLAACARDETIYSYGGAGGDWQLQRLNGTDFPAEATLRCGPDRIGPDLPQPGPGGRTVLCCRSGLRAWRAAEKLADTRAGTLVLLATG